MKKSESIKELATALATANLELKNTERNSVNPFYKSKYAELNKIIDETKQILANHGLSVIQGNEMVDDGVVITTMLLHASGEWIESYLQVPVIKKDPQGVGGAITYGRRYAYSAIIGISTEDDDDGNNNVDKAPARSTAVVLPLKNRVEIMQSKSLEELKEVCGKLREALESKYLNEIVRIYNIRKAQLEK